MKSLYIATLTVVSGVFTFQTTCLTHHVKRPTVMKRTIIRLLAILSAAVLAAQLNASTWVTKFDGDPQASGWQAFGNTNLFQWNSAEEQLQVTWDSAQPNSYYALPLGKTLSRTNDFLLGFNLHLNDIAVGTTEGKPFTFEIAIGLMHHTQTTNASLARGSGLVPNLVEFDYFPNDVNEYGASISTALISASTNYWSGGFTFPLELATNTHYRVQMVFNAARQTLHSTLTSNGVPAGPLADATIGPDFGDFQVDTVAVSSYSDEGQFPGYEGSILAHGSVDNIVVASPLPVGLLALASSPNEVVFLGETNWVYTLEATTNLHSWYAVGLPVPGDGTTLTLTDTNPPAGLGAYRVRADLP